MKKISIFLVLTLVLTALVLPAFAYGKGKPATTPGKGPLGAAGRPSAILSVAAENTGPAVGRIKGKGWKKFVLEGTVVGKSEGAPDDPAYPNFYIKIKSGTVKRIKAARGSILKITALSETTKKGDTIYRSKEEKFKADFQDLKLGARVHVKGDIVWSEDFATVEALNARRIVIKPKPIKTKGDDD